MLDSWRLLVMAALAAWIAVLPGCGTRTADQITVQGSVTLDGKPLESAIITFLPVDGKGASGGATVTAGQYKTELAPGEKKVSIFAERVVGTQKRDPADPNSATVEVKQQYLPACYNTSTTLKATIPADGGATVDFALKSQ